MHQTSNRRWARRGARTGRVTDVATVLGIWAHPDDETWLAGGLLADAARRGARVHTLHMTHGEAGQCAHGPVSAGKLAQIRTAELTAALRHLGVHDQHVLDYPDGQLASISDERAVTSIHGELAAVNPDVVVTFGPDGFTGHPDHRRLSGWVDAAVSRWGGNDATVLQAAVSSAWTERFVPALNEFSAFWPGYPQATALADIDRSLALDSQLLNAKMAALKAHASQMQPLFDAYGEGFFRALGSCERFRQSTPRPVPAHRGQRYQTERDTLQ